MSRSPDVKEDPMECPLCMEPLEIDDVNFFPCTCGYQICRFCWHRIRTDENGLCPACRKPYPEDPAVYKPLSQEEIQRIKNEKKQKQNEKKQKVTENRKHLASVRVVQRNLVFVVGLSQRLADPEVLKRPEYFGKFGKIHKVVINNSTSYAGSQGPSASAYVTYLRSEDALRAIQCVNNVVVDGRTLKASLGTTKYCSYFLKSMQCPKPDCMYLHELGDEAASFTKEEMQAGKHQEYEQKLLQDLYKMNPTFLQPSACGNEKSKGKSSTSQRPGSTNKDGWPLLQGCGKVVNGLPTENRKTPPVLDCGSDSDHMTPDGQDSEELCPDQGTDISPFPSALDPSRVFNGFSPSCCSPIDNPPESNSITENGETISQFPQLPNSDSPSPPPGLTRPSLLVPISVSDLTARSPFEGAAAESRSLFSDNSNFRHPNPLPSSLPSGPCSPQGGSDWPMTPEPQSLFTSDTIPVSSSTDWQAAFGFGSSSTQQQQQDDDLGFDPFDVTRKALADLIEKELSVQEPPSSSALSPDPFHNHAHAHLYRSSLAQRFGHLHQRAPVNGHLGPMPNQTTSRHPWMGTSTRNNLVHLNHTAVHSSFLDLNLPVQEQHPPHSTGLGGIPISENNGSIESLNVKEWQDGLRALLPNININFGGLPSSTSSSSSSSSSSSVNHIGGPGGSLGGVSHSLSWDATASWMDPAIITAPGPPENPQTPQYLHQYLLNGIPSSAGNSLDCLQDDNPPHWLKSLQALTEMDAPASTAAPPQQQQQQQQQQPQHHTGMLDMHLSSLHRAGWAPYLPPPSTATPSHFHSPPPGFQTAFRPPAQTATADLLQNAAMDRH
ncbi:CCR4-NOT transcription complex subunit 4 isoform X2 [Clupea harengus]|uniref:CCR4-NOT transcription complex subunit 4 n=1 Tax=Clupea harengus TaxID=7950 RepID=A0A6P8FAT6_CLUHA|nr:CCR4-NOT transcription complex subunit 4 isoform X2 [Clupea harengus]